MIGVTRLTLDIEDNVVIVRREHSTGSDRAAILGRVVENGKERLFLDRRIHHGDAVDSNNHWSISGAYTTVLTRL